MDVCMLLGEGYPPDIRVRKEARTLLADGHDVTLLCHRENGDPSREAVHGIEVIRRPFQNAHSGPRGFLRGAIYVATHVHHAWADAIVELHDTSPIDVLHVHDLPLVKTALTVAAPRDIRVVADLHENWPEAVRQYRRSKNWGRVLRDPRYLLSSLALPIWRLKRLERQCVRRADHVITVVEEAKSHYVKDCNVSPRKVSVISNVVSLEQFDTQSVEPAPVDDEFVVTYVGSLRGEHRGLGTVIDAMPALLSEVPGARLLVVGSGSEYETRLRDRARERGVADAVTFTGWVDFEAVPSYVAASDVCLVPHASTPHTETTVPHKLFQYMAIGKPTVVTDVAPLERIVDETGCGLVVPAGDSAAMADALLSLSTDPDQAAAMGERGRQAVIDTYNWRRESATLTAIYDSLRSGSSVLG